ncbi:MAG: class II glutamine amidotransferase [Phycisphaerales bacterium]|jgi:glutamine amidotransferase|nr:class II glutamine amidotransferase [Phycisphaerales bacterium]
MCRWLAYHGPEIRLSTLLHDPEHSLLVQSKHATQSSWVVNGDGVGIGWYDHDPDPGQYRETRAAWNDENVKSLARHTRSGLFLAHVRAVTQGVVSRTNTHPFLMGDWLFQHNGDIGGFKRMQRRIDACIEDPWFGGREGQTDSETMFALALTHGLREDPVAGINGMIRTVLELRDDLGVDDPFMMSIATTGGEALWCARFATGTAAPSLYWGRGLNLCNCDGSTTQLDDQATIVVSEPLDTEEFAWREVPDGSLIRVDATGVAVQSLDV